MKFLKTALVTTAISAFAASAHAQDSGVYINAGVQTISFDSAVDDDNSTSVNLLARLGYNFGEYFGVEAEGSINIAPQDIEFNGVDLEEKVSNQFGGYLVGRYPVADQFDIFARAGYYSAKVRLSAEGNGVDESESATANGFAIGAGAQYNFDDKNGVRLGYTYFDEDGANANSLDLVYVRKF